MDQICGADSGLGLAGRLGNRGRGGGGQRRSSAFRPALSEVHVGRGGLQAGHPHPEAPYEEGARWLRAGHLVRQLADALVRLAVSTFICWVKDLWPWMSTRKEPGKLSREQYREQPRFNDNVVQCSQIQPDHLLGAALQLRANSGGITHYSGVTLVHVPDPN